jgi:hypothetical protein
VIEPTSIPITRMSTVLSPRGNGRWRVRHRTMPKGTVLTDWTPKLGMHRIVVERPTRIVVLEEDRQTTWMSDTPLEYHTNEEAIRRARGRVLEVGLGIGLFTFHVRDKPEVESVTVVEQEREVADIVYPQIASVKTDLVVMEGFQFLRSTARRFDFIHLDVWPIYNYEGAEQFIEAAKDRLLPGGEVSVWMLDQNRAIMNTPLNAEFGGLVFTPCKACGKSPRGDYDGLCIDCFDGLRATRATQ